MDFFAAYQIQTTGEFNHVNQYINTRPPCPMAEDLTYGNYLNSDFITNDIIKWDKLHRLMEIVQKRYSERQSKEQLFFCVTNQIKFPNFEELTIDDILAPYMPIV